LRVQEVLLQLPDRLGDGLVDAERPDLLVLNAERHAEGMRNGLQHHAREYCGVGHWHSLVYAGLGKLVEQLRGHSHLILGTKQPYLLPPSLDVDAAAAGLLQARDGGLKARFQRARAHQLHPHCSGQLLDGPAKVLQLDPDGLDRLGRAGHVQGTAHPVQLETRLAHRPDVAEAPPATAV
jgi:hypothetical protein